MNSKKKRTANGEMNNGQYLKSKKKDNESTGTHSSKEELLTIVEALIK